MSELPAGWRWSTVGEECEVSGGLTKNAGKREASRDVAPLVSVAAVHLRRIDPDKIGSVGLLPGDGDRARLRRGDLLVVEGNGSLDQIGRAALWDDEVPNARHQNHIIRVRPRGVPARFVLEWLASPRGRDAIVDAATSGAGLYTLSISKVERLRLPIPPDGQAQPIVDKLDSLQKRSRGARSALESIPPLIEKLRQSILAAAFRGDLTKDWRAKNPDVEPASELLAEARRQHRAMWERAALRKLSETGKHPTSDRWKDKYVPPATPDNHALPALPDGWCWTTLGLLAWSVKDGPHHSPSYSESGIPFVSGRNIRAEGIDFSTAKFISAELHAQYSERCVPELNDLLYTKGGTTGIARVNTYTHPFNVWVHVAVLKLLDTVHPFYLQHALNSPHCVIQAQRLTHGVGNQDLGLTRMVGITVPLAPKDEQAAVIDLLNRWLERASAIEHQINKRRQTISDLERAVLSTAFAGAF